MIDKTVWLCRLACALSAYVNSDIFERVLFFAKHYLSFFSNDWALFPGDVYDDATLCNASVVTLP